MAALVPLPVDSDVEPEHEVACEKCEELTDSSNLDDQGFCSECVAGDAEARFNDRYWTAARW